MPGSTTAPGPTSARANAPAGVAFHRSDGVGTRNQSPIAAQWLAYAFPCRRFACTLADTCARLGADAVRYTFIAVDLHHLLLAGLPAHHFRLETAEVLLMICPGLTS
jgi:hypothetical protein